MRSRGLLQALKGLKDTGSVAPGNANALVTNGDAHPRRITGFARRSCVARFQLDTSPLWGIFDGVFPHIEQDLPEPIRVGPDWWQRRCYVAAKLIFAWCLLVRAHLSKLAHLVAQPFHIYVGGTQGNLAMLAA